MDVKPSFKVIANDKNITDLIADRFIELRITDEVNQKSDLLSIRLDDGDNKIVVPSNDVELTVELGYDGKLEKMGVFSGLELVFLGPPDIVVIRASAMNLRKGMKAKKSRSFENISFGDLMSTIANEHGYTALVDDFIASIVFPYIAQTNETDWQLINRLTRDYDAFIKASGGKLVVAMRDGKKSLATQGQLPVVEVDRSDVEKWDIKHNDKTKIKSVKAKWYDKGSALMSVYEAGSGEPKIELKKTYDSEAQAKLAAEAKLKRMHRLEKTGRVTMAGRTALVAMGTLSLKNGFRENLKGEYTLNRVDHVLSASRGYRCECDIEV